MKENIKKKRLKIKNIEDINYILHESGFKNINLNEENFRSEFNKLFKLDEELLESIFMSLKDEVIYKIKDIKEFVDYIEKINLFEDLNIRLSNKLKYIKTFVIDRVEYESDDNERVKINNIDLSLEAKRIEKIKDKVSFIMNEEEKSYLKNLETIFSENIVFSKDIEIIKKMILNEENLKLENYDENTKVRSIEIKLPKELNFDYIKADKGSVEYYNTIKLNLPRVHRLVNNLDKYLEKLDSEKGKFKINQSELIQDTTNFALVKFNDKYFKAISGKNEVEGYCRSPKIGDENFESYNVNKLGKLGIGYNRINDSEKKILEEIHNKIENNMLKDEGDLILYTNLEPCPSCYLVIKQFLEKHPKINLKVKYNYKY